MKTNNIEAVRPQRRVGTFTMGLAMIAIGACLLCWLMGWIDRQTFFQICRLSPLLLVGTGIELCIFGAAGDRVQMKYDFAAVLLCGLLLCMTLGLSVLSVISEQWLLRM